MRKTCIVSVFVILIASACNKETKEIFTTTQPTETAPAPVPCSGNEWQANEPYYGHERPMVFKNKVYVPDMENNKVRIYDGSSWSSIRSNVPGYNEFKWAFTIGNKGYVLDPALRLLWEYDFASNTWTPKANFPGAIRHDPAVFSIGSKAYIVGGRRSSPGENPPNLSDTWEYDQVSDSWLQKASLGYIGRDGAVGFSIDNKGYIVGGQVVFPNGMIYLKEVLAYDPATNSWTQKEWFAGANRAYASAFVIDDRAYVGGGKAGSAKFKDFYKYNPATNNWSSIADIVPATIERSLYGFSINSRGYVSWINSFNTTYDPMQKYTPLYCGPITPEPAGSVLKH
jgi:hypothetical protein